MPTPYSYNLRQKVINAIDDGGEHYPESSIFKISCNTINIELHRRETRDIRGKTGAQKRYDPKIPDLEELKKFVHIVGTLYANSLKKKWQMNGQKQFGIEL